MTAARGPGVALGGVTKRYGPTTALDDIEIHIEPGQFIALVGGSGSGKSTFVRLVNRLVEPEAGHVLIDGRDVRAGDVYTLRRAIGHVIQGVGLFPHMTVGQNISAGLRIGRDRPIARRTIDARVDELLDLVELPRDFASRSPATLSGGQRQRVGFARALAPAPGLMLLDEPFGALDPITRATLATAYRALHDRLGLTSIMVTHDMAEALLTADRVVVMAAGRIVSDATPTELLKGDGGADAQALVAVPREQAARLDALMRGGTL